jgi:hypothetical protein
MHQNGTNSKTAHRDGSCLSQQDTQASNMQQHGWETVKLAKVIWDHLPVGTGQNNDKMYQ